MTRADPGAAAPGHRRTRPVRSLVLAAAGIAGLALVLSSCSSSPSASKTTSGQHHHSKRKKHSTTTTTKPSSSTTTSTSTTTTTTTAPAAASTLCQPSQLQLAVSGQTGAAGTLTLTVAMTNTSSSTCTMDGYPGMQLLTGSGSQITTTVVRGQAHFPNPTANATSASVSLASGAEAKFSLQFSDVPVGGETSCPSSSKAEVTPPTDTAYAVMTLSIAPCDNGMVHVSPVYDA